MYLYYGFGFLTLEQNYQCRVDETQQFSDCSVATICLNQLNPGF